MENLSDGRPMKGQKIPGALQKKPASVLSKTSFQITGEVRDAACPINTAAALPRQ